MNKKELMIKAHEMTREIKAKYPEVNYKFQFGLCLTYLQNEGVEDVKELKGSEKQVKWANEVRESLLKGCDLAIEYLNELIEKKKAVKHFTRRLDNAKKIKVGFENEEKASYFIENFGACNRKETVEVCNIILDKTLKMEG